MTTDVTGFIACDCAADRVPVPGGLVPPPTADGAGTAAVRRLLVAEMDHLVRLVRLVRIRHRWLSGHDCHQNQIRCQMSVGAAIRCQIDGVRTLRR